MSEKGNRNNHGKLRWRNLPMFLLEDVIKIGEIGEINHSTFNFLKGFPINDTLDSLKRHLNKFESPYESDMDEETKINHLAHVAWNALAALHTYKTRPDLDDRWKPETQATDSAKLRDLKIIKEGMLDKDTLLSFEKKNPDDTSK